VLHETFMHNVSDFVFRGESGPQFAVGFIGALGLILTIVQYPGGIGQQIKPITRWLAGGPFTFHDDSDSGPGAVEGSSVRA
jgi:hypothetical protein